MGALFIAIAGFTVFAIFGAGLAYLSLHFGNQVRKHAPDHGTDVDCRTVALLNDLKSSSHNGGVSNP